MVLESPPNLIDRLRVVMLILPGFDLYNEGLSQSRDPTSFKFYKQIGSFVGTALSLLHCFNAWHSLKNLLNKRFKIFTPMCMVYLAGNLFQMWPDLL